MTETANAISIFGTQIPVAVFTAGVREMNYAARLHEAGIIDSGTLLSVRWAFVRGSVLSWVALVGVILLAWFGRRARRRPGGALLHGVLFGLLRGMLRRR